MFLTTINNVDRHGVTRRVPMQVLCLGFPRTGTVPMHTALEMLGYNETNHGYKVSTNPRDREMWIEAINAKFFGKGTPYGRKEWDQLLGHTVTDMPHTLFAEELIRAYPEAKVVLTLRDPDRWWRSFADTIGTAIRGPIGVNPWFEPRASVAIRMFWGLALGALFGTPEPAPEAAKARFVAHYDEVRRLVPKERLLEYRVGEGWERLYMCGFLAKQVPAEAFPKVNDTEAYHGHVTRRNRAILRQAALKYVVPAVVAALGIFVYYRGCFKALA
ncbi:hypothetical protein GGX14DRAFT_443507 [Mycena pura]|uniref:NAD dependent epimerase/dehydratase n=1 Tax=Mycena pura TaxID=153505 RepID=A0AAD6VKQ3_9AGAR|nr:hypothetical protein GGX14DRAFT_443507 [Mycena pura]